MKKFNAIITTIILALVTNIGYSQEIKRDFSLGLGFAPRYGLIDSRISEMKVPHITFNWDHNLVPEVGPGRITFGHYFGISYYEGAALFIDDTGFSGGINFLPADLITLDIGVRGAYVLTPVLDGKLEPYAGLQYNYYVTLAIANGDDTDDLESDGEIFNSGDVSGFVGARYLFSERNSLFVEVNPGYLLWRVGFTFKKFR